MRTRFKRIIIDGHEIDQEMLEKYYLLSWRAYKSGMEVDPETMTIVPIKEQTKQWEDGDRMPVDYQEWGED